MGAQRVLMRKPECSSQAYCPHCKVGLTQFLVILGIVYFHQFSVTHFRRVLSLLRDSPRDPMENYPLDKPTRDSTNPESAPR